MILPPQGWRITQIIARGFVFFPPEANVNNEVTKSSIKHHYAGSCFLRINGQTKKRHDTNVRSFFFFIPGKAIQLVFFQKGVRAVIEKILKQEFPKNVCLIRGEVSLNNFHYQGIFNFHWFVLISHIIPALEDRFDFSKIEVKVYQEDGVPAIEVDYRNIQPNVAVTQVFVKVWENGRKIITLKAQKAKSKKKPSGLGAEKVQTHISLVTCTASNKLREIQELISLQSTWQQDN